MMVISATYRTCAHCCLRPQRVTLTSAFMGRSALPRLRRDRGAQSHRAVHRTSLSTASTTATGEGTSQQAPASCTFPSPSPTLASSSVASPSTSPPTACSVTLLCSSVFDTHRVAALVSAAVSAGDVLLLWGDVGAGKSEFARGFLRAWTAQPQLTVRSPTYTLMHDYAHGQLTAHHLDLYRLQEEGELSVLPLQRIFQQDVCLVEWPEHLHSLTPPHALSVRLSRREEEESRWAGEEETAGRLLVLESSAAKWKAAIEQWRRDSEQLGIHVSR